MCSQGFCPEKADDLRFCGTSWDFENAVNKFSSRQGKFVQKRCLPYTVPSVDDQGTTCRWGKEQGTRASRQLQLAQIKANTYQPIWVAVPN